MSTAIIELNDSGIVYYPSTAQQIALLSPGYALLQDQRVITGQQALQQAWLHPQQSFNQYWYQLSLSPLTISNQHARHHADLAYAQLQQLYADTGKPQQMIFAMPSNTTAEQLGILLGLAKASSFQAAGLVDAAVAAASQSGLQGKLVHADIQLHTTVLSQLNSTDQVQKERATQYPDIPLKAILDTWAQFIADRFIREYRYDPLHTAAGEQQLHDRLPDWINQLNTHAEIETELSAPQGDFRLRIQRSEFIAVNQPRWQRLIEALASTPFDKLLLTNRLANLPGVIDSLNAAGHHDIVVLAADATIAACLAQGDAITGAIDNSENSDLHFVTALPILPSSGSNKTLTSKPSHEILQSAQHPNLDKRPATHLLSGHRAYSLAQDLVLLSNGKLLITRETPNNPANQIPTKPVAELNRNGGRLVLNIVDSSNDIICDGDWRHLYCGDTIHIAGQTLMLIEVS